MTQQLTLFDPSLEYYCHSCRKPLKYSVRVIAKITGFGCYLDFCPPCLAHQGYSDKIQDYFISKKVGPIFKQININASQLLQSIATVQEEGIQQMFLRCLKSQDRNFQVYEQLNNNVFGEVRPQLRIIFGQYKIGVGGVQKEKLNPPNRKHLKTLGYNWQRQEFNLQPEVIFGYLMGCLQEQAEPTQDQIELRNIVYHYYNQEVQIIEQIKDFLIESPFLLARKAIYDIQQVPRQLTELKNIESEIKQLVTSICSMSVNDESQESTPSSLNKYGERVKDRQKKTKKEREHSQRSMFQDKDQRQRTRQKKNKKKQNKYSKQQSANLQNVGQQNTPKDELIEMYQGRSDNEEVENKRKRGRPKGSKSKVKTQRRRGKSRIFELKMDIQHKISHKCQKIDLRELQEENESFQNRKRRKLNEQTQSQEQQSESQQEKEGRQSNSEE